MSTMIRALRRSMLLTTIVLGWNTTARASAVGLYDFTPVNGVSPNLAPNPQPYSNMGPQAGASFTDANALGRSLIGDRLGSAGEVTKPTAETGQRYGFWAPKALINGLPEWSLLFWVNRRSATGIDMLWYLGAGDGFGYSGPGSGAETYVFADASGTIGMQNYTRNNIKDMEIVGPALQIGQWHQIGIVRQGTATSLYVDGQLRGSDAASAWDSFNDTTNSVMVLGGVKWPSHNDRALDGLLDQVEIYDQALSAGQVMDRYGAFAAVPTPTSAAVGMVSLVLMGIWKARSSRQHPSCAQ